MEETKHIAIFTTASLPWMTGTAVNPLFRAAYLEKKRQVKVSLVVPWLSKKDQVLVYPNNVTFDSAKNQEKYIRQWLEERTGFASNFIICFYPEKFSEEKRSILAVGDITELIPDEVADVAVLEEPEHLTWYHHGRRWKSKFRHVIGVVHTNYLEYVKREQNGQVQAFLLKHINNWVTHIYCHKVIRLSAATQELPRSVVCNVHGVNPKFIEVGKKMQEQHQQEHQIFPKGAYFIGKMVWSKGYKEMLQLLSDNQEQLSGFEIDMYGNGEDSEEIKDAVNDLRLTVNVYPGRDHADPLFIGYKVFINPSTTDVVCTTTAEALAMGKIVICADHPSNEFFKKHPNCRTYRDPTGFAGEVLASLSAEPAPVTSEQQHELSWEAATERFLHVAGLSSPSEKPAAPKAYPWGTQFMSLSESMENIRQYMEDVPAFVHFSASGVEATRRALGAIPDSIQPDEEQCRELGLPFPQVKHEFR